MTEHVSDNKASKAVAFVREIFWNDGAEGESVHILCDAVEHLTKERDEARAKWQEADRNRAAFHRSLCDCAGERDKLRAQTRWIPVEERLPEDGQHVLAWAVPGIVAPHQRLLRFKWGSFNDENHDYWHVTHWMPLPDPPEVER